MYRLDLISKKWSQKEFAEEQMCKHFLECGELLQAENPHFINELMDLKTIVDYYMWCFCDQKEIIEVEEKRIEKFRQKARNDVS